MKVRLYHGFPRRVLITLFASAMVIGIIIVIATVVLIRISHQHPSGLIHAGDSKTTCVYVSLGPKLHYVEQETGITFNCIETFDTEDPTWSEWVSPWVTTENRYGYKAWVTANPTKHQIILTKNLIPDSVASDPEWTSKCAAGYYDVYARKLARNLVNSGFDYSVIRLGVEMNGTWNPGSLGTTPTQWHQWGRCFAQEVQAMRAVRGGHLLFDWNINANYRDIPLADFYPGNAYVDIIGIDAYDNSAISLPGVGSPARWAALTSEPDGLDAVETFAAEHGKPLSIPEWATVRSQGDDADYVTNMGDFVTTHDIAFQAWFDAGDDGIYPLNRTQAPLSLAAYKKLFG